MIAEQFLCRADKVLNEKLIILNSMNKEITEKMIRICNQKIESKGENVGLSFYAFFANKNDDPETLMQVATWWIQTHKLDHFEKATKIKQLVLKDNNYNLSDYLRI